MPNDIEMRRMVDALNRMTREIHVQNKILSDLAGAVIGIRKELARGHEAAAAGSSGFEASDDARGGETDWLVGSGGGQGSEAVRPRAPYSGHLESHQRSQKEVEAELEAKRPIHGE